MTQVLTAYPVPPVTGDLQDSQDHQANQEPVDLVQVIHAERHTVHEVFKKKHDV